MHEEISLNVSALIKIFGLTFLTYILAMGWTPILVHFLFKWRIYQKIRKARETPIFAKLHKIKENVPTMGGLLVWVTVLVVTVLFNLSRGQTYLPLFALVATGLLGAVDDLYNVREIHGQRGLRGRHKLLWQFVIAGLGSWWFFYKLGYDTIHIPGVGDFIIGWWYIPLFIFVIIAAANAVNITDGLDGLAGGLLALAYLAFGGIAFVQGNLGIAIFCGCVTGALLAFLWFNIYPARFFMGDTGSLALGAVLGVIAMLTNTVLVLPVIGFVFMLETMSVILQVGWRKLTRGKKIFLSAPLHHHFEALGWPETKVTMRFWVIGAMMAIIGFVIALIGRG